jgi:hypothetical protein
MNVKEGDADGLEKPAVSTGSCGWILESRTWSMYLKYSRNGRERLPSG